jgi:hypothetical protein
MEIEFRVELNLHPFPKQMDEFGYLRKMGLPLNITLFPRLTPLQKQIK